MPTSLMFWNVERLGAGTDADIKDGIVYVADAQKATYEAYCELTQACQVMTPWNLTYRKKKSQQICYGARQYTALPNPVVYPIPTQMVMTRVVPLTTPAYQQANYPGGNDFTKLTARAPASYAMALNGVFVFVYHAPANAAKAERAVAFLACYLTAAYPANNWLLIGDLNVEPGQLANSGVGIPLAQMIVSTGEPTHQKYKELDYAISNNPNMFKIWRVKANQRYQLSDHRPICVAW